MNNNISACLDEADDLMLDDFDPDEDDIEEEVLDNLKSSDESVENKGDSEMSCSDDSFRNDFRVCNKGKYNIIKWYTDPSPCNVRTPQRNIVLQHIFPRNYTRLNRRMRKISSFMQIESNNCKC